MYQLVYYKQLEFSYIEIFKIFLIFTEALDVEFCISMGLSELGQRTASFTEEPVVS